MNRPGESKPQMGLVPPLASLAIAVVYGHGLHKHPAFGWRNENPQEFKDAAERHHLYQAAGELYDFDSGLLHQAHEAADAMIALELEIYERPLWIPEAAR